MASLYSYSQHYNKPDIVDTTGNSKLALCNLNTGKAANMKGIKTDHLTSAIPENSNH